MRKNLPKKSEIKFFKATLTNNEFSIIKKVCKDLDVSNRGFIILLLESAGILERDEDKNKFKQ